MNDRDNGDQSDADWLAAQFGATGGVPTPKKPEPQKPESQKPADPPTQADPPTLVNPFGPPGGMAPPVGPGAAYPPPTPAAPPPPATPPLFPGFPPAGPPPIAQPPAAQPPVVPPPAVQQPAAAPFPPSAPAWQAPASASVPPATPPAQPTPPVEPTATRFPWELAPGGDPAAQQPLAPSSPPAPSNPPVPPTPVVPQQPSWDQPVVPPTPAAPAVPAVPPAFPWEIAAAAAAPHEPAPLDPAFDGAPQFAAEPPLEPMPWETARLPEVAPESADAPTWDPAATQAMDQPMRAVDQPTQAMDQSSWSDPPPTQLILPPTEAFGVAAAATELLGASPDPANAPSSALDALFGEERFREYEAGADEAENPFARKDKEEAGSTKAAGVGTTQKVLLWVAGGLVGAIALVALFLVGTRLPDLFGPAPVVSQSASPSPSPSPTVLPVGPLAPGTYAWDELLGGECLDPFASHWDEEFTVVDCTVPHPAQMVFRGEFPVVDPANDAYPGEAALQSQITLLCSAPGVIDLAAAGLYADAQFQASFPATEQQWDDGDHSYFCFVSRSSGEPLTGSVAIPPPPPAAPAAP